MGETISTLVFRPPPPTPIKANKFFYLRIPKNDVHPRLSEEFSCANATCGAITSPAEMEHFFSHHDDEEEEEEDNGVNNDYNGIPTNDLLNSRNQQQKVADCANNHNNPMNNSLLASTSKSNKQSTKPNEVPPPPSYISPLTINSSTISNNNETNNNNQNNEYKIPAFFLRRKGAKLTILFSHGNAEDLGMMYRRMKEMAMLLCANVLAYDYTGYGLSTPNHTTPSEHLCYKNIQAAYHHLTKVMHIPPAEIVLYGRSLGSGPSCYLAQKTAEDGESVAGLILHSPFLSIYRIVIDCRINLVGDMFVNKSRAKDVR